MHKHRFVIKVTHKDGKITELEVDNVRLSDTNFTYKFDINDHRWKTIWLRDIADINISHEWTK